MIATHANATQLKKATIMSNAFNPFAAPTQSAPVQAPAPAAQFAPPPAAAPQRPVASSMNDATQYDGYTTPFLKHVDLDLDVEVLEYKGLRTDKLGRACHIFFKVLASTTPEVPVGSEWRCAYRYDFERSERSDTDQYGSDQRTLGLFVQALFGRKVGDGFDAVAAERALHTPEGQAWIKAAPRVVHLHGKLGKAKTKIDPRTHAQTTSQYRNDLWMPVRK